MHHERRSFHCQWMLQKHNSDIRTPDRKTNNAD